MKKNLVISYLSNIEGRVLAYLADEVIRNLKQDMIGEEMK